MNKKPSENRTIHLVFLQGVHLQEIVAGRKRFEIRLSFGGLACASVRQGDVLLLKRVGGEVEAAYDVGEVLIYRGLRPEEVARLARSYANATSRPYLRRYVPPHNRDRPVNLAIIELLNVCPASLPTEPTELTPRGGEKRVGHELRRRLRDAEGAVGRCGFRDAPHPASLASALIRSIGYGAAGPLGKPTPETDRVSPRSP